MAREKSTPTFHSKFIVCLLKSKFSFLSCTNIHEEAKTCERCDEHCTKRNGKTIKDYEDERKRVTCTHTCSGWPNQNCNVKVHIFKAHCSQVLFRLKLRRIHIGSKDPVNHHLILLEERFGTILSKLTIVDE